MQKTDASQLEFLPVCEPMLAGRELEYVTEAVRTGWISSAGKYVEQFEKGFAAYCGASYGISVSNGTVAVHLALIGAGIKEGDEVIVPTFTMAGSIFPIAYLGAKAVFVDCDRETWNINVDAIEEKITDRTKAIMPVHIYGHPCDMARINAIAKKHNLVVVEDAAEAIGSRVNGKVCGGIGDIAAFSFFSNKVITTGEGGMVVTSNKEFYDRCRYFRNLCFPLEGPRRYIHDDIGFNFRMPNVLAAIGLGQLERIEDYVNRRRNNAARYNKILKDVEGITLPVERPGCVNSYWMYGILIEDEFGLSRDEVMAKLREQKIETRYFFQPMHSQKGVTKYQGPDHGSYPVAEELAQRGLYLPSGSALTDAQISRVCESLVSLKR